MGHTEFYKKLKKLVDKQEKEQGLACGLADALTELRHIADETGQSFGEADKRAYQNYLCDKEQGV
jgi:hypothetical protein